MIALSGCDTMPTTKGELMKFRQNLLHLRQQRNMTQEQLAMLLGVSRQSVAKWEAGQSTPEVDKLMRMAELFECSLDELVNGDLSGRTVRAAEVLPPDAAPQDTCGYDRHFRLFSLSIATGVAIIIAATALVSLCDALLPWNQNLSGALLLVCVAIGIIVIIPAGIEHAAFTRNHPFVEDFYTEEEKGAVRRSFTRGLAGGIGFILLGCAIASAFDNTPLENVAGSGFLATIAAGVWLIVRFGILYGASRVENYNKERTDEIEERTDPLVGPVCGIIMLAATIVGLTMLWVGGYPDQDAMARGPFADIFWVAWPIGGILCAIAALVLKIRRNAKR